LRHAPFAALVSVCALVFIGAAPAGENDSGFHTSTPSMITPLAPGSSVKPIISVGDTLGSGYMFESIPDGIALSRVNGRGTADIFVNHELSLVPFQGRVDFTNSILSNLRLNQHSAGVLKGEYAIPSSANYQRFCSNFMVGREHGFERELLFTNEEARDIVLRSGLAWHPPGVSLSEPSAEQAGVVVALDPKSGAYRSIYGMGRHNHENAVGIPGYGHPVVLSGDDTFDAPASQLYSYVAPSGEAVWNDTGDLYVFVSGDPAINDYGDLTLANSTSGQFVKVPKEIATGKKDGREVTSLDYDDIPLPPTGIPDGPQWVLEYWSHNLVPGRAFQFIRVEDIAYDRNNPRIVYLADTGEPRAVPDGAGRLRRGSSTAPDVPNGPYPNGRIFKLVLNANDPLKVDSLSVLIDADALGYFNPGALHQPDNLETTANSLLIQEDPGGHQQSSATGPRAAMTNARVWRYTLPAGPLVPVAEVSQALRPASPRGAWESSGIVDASAVFGPGAFLLDVQAHGFEVTGPVPSPFPGVNAAREGGQLLLFELPGS
jgi:hypothetical protein